jgi:hypothetical protein
MLTEEKAIERDTLEIMCTEMLVPKDHLLRKIDAAVAFKRIYEIVGDLYMPGTCTTARRSTASTSRSRNAFPKSMLSRWTPDTKRHGSASESSRTSEFHRTPYKRPMTKRGNHEWWKYVYDEYYDCVICPEYNILKYSLPGIGFF